MNSPARQFLPYLGIALVAAVLFLWIAGAQKTTPPAPKSSAQSAAAVPDSGAPAAASSSYQPADGKHAVKVLEEILLPDAKRKKDLPVRVTYPNDAGPFPVIIFSHGVGGSNSCCADLVRYWAGQGYVILQPTHADSIEWQKKQQAAADDKDKKRRVQRPLAALRDPDQWAGRAGDVSFLIDSLAELEKKVPALQGKLDSSRVGVGGHSYGAYTSQLIAGATVDVPGEEKGRSFADPRPAAFLLLSGQGRGQQGLTDNSWARLTRPMMSATGSRDRGAKGQPPDWKKEPFDLSPPGDKYHLFLHGAWHGTFVGRTGEGEEKNLERIASGQAGLRQGASGDASSAKDVKNLIAEQKILFGYVQKATTAFWDAYLKKQPAAKAYLQSDSLPASSNGALQLWRK